MLFKMQITVVVVLLISGCSSVSYQARGVYNTEENKERELLLQWKAQKYYIPFLGNDIDYGSYSFQEECRPNVLQDTVDGDQYGFAFKERGQNFTVISGTPIQVGNHIICAKTKDDMTLSEIKSGDELLFEVLCKARRMAPITPAGIYTLKVTESEEAGKLECRD